MLLAEEQTSDQEPLVLPESIREELVAHAREGVPDEVCGILAGQERHSSRLFRIRNTADAVAAEQGVFQDRSSGEGVTGHKPVHYYMDPRDQLRVYKEMDAAGLDVVAYYHSHTHTEARPSPTDIRLASDLTALYVLVGLQAEHPSVRAWRIVKEAPESVTGTLVELNVVPA